MGLPTSEILALAGGGSGGFYSDVLGKVDLTFDPIPAAGTLEVPTGIILVPPAGQFVFIPLRIEYVSKALGGSKGVGMALGKMHFTNAGGTPDTRADGYGWTSLYAPTVSVVNLSVAPSGELSVSFQNPNGVAGWARASLIVAAPMVTIA